MWCLGVKLKEGTRTTRQWYILSLNPTRCTNQGGVGWSSFRQSVPPLRIVMQYSEAAEEGRKHGPDVPAERLRPSICLRCAAEIQFSKINYHLDWYQFHDGAWTMVNPDVRKSHRLGRKTLERELGIQGDMGE